MQTSKLALVLSSLLAVTLAQQQQLQQQQLQQQQSSASSDNKQVRLEDIERDTLTNAQHRQQQQQQSQQQPTQQYGTLAQQQLAAYQQQQYLLQQLQQQQPYFPQALGAYPNPYSALPLMILPGNQLGVGPVGPAQGIPLQYFLPDASFLYQQPAPAGANPAAAFASPLLASSPIYQVPAGQAIQARYRPVSASNAVQYRSNHQSQQSAQSQPQSATYQQTAYQQQPTYQQSAIASSAATSQQVYQPQSQYYQQSQPSYNAYNSLYSLQQQRPQKNLFSSGVKSTVSPPTALKSSQSLSSINAYSQPLSGSDQASSYINYKTF